MKRKRGRKTTGSKKSASKAAAAAAAVAAEDASPKSPSSPSTQENSSPGEQPETSAPAVVAIQPVPQPAPAPPPQPEKPPAAAAAPAEIKPKVYSRVKLKFRSAKVVESSSEAQAPAAAAAAAPAAGGGGNSASAAAAPGESRQVAVEKAAVALHGQIDGQAPESSGVDMDKASWKVGSIKIKSAVLSMVEDSNQEKKAGSVSETLPSKPETVLEIGESEAAAEPRNSQELELNQSTPERRRDEKELTAALEAIKKVMKMDAAEPFNIPVDPVALGIPDYLDIIDTPMDFGTICQDLERGNKYLNSEDVYKDVQYIWDNCTKYNSKGDYIIELMKRVKKGFMKYWLAAGLYSDVQDNGGNDNTGDEDAKGNSKGKPKPKRRRPGNDRHKNDCACAVCQVTRRKKEKDEILSIIDNETAVMNSNNSDQHIMEVSSGNNNPGSHDTTSSQEQPPQTDVYRATVDADDSGNQMENIGKFFSHRSFPLADYADEGSRQYSEGKEEGEYKDLTSQEEHTSTQPNDGSEIAHQQHKAPTDTSEEVEMEDYPVLQENHSFLQLCARLFPSNQSSVFRGRHSLFRRRRQVPLKESPLHAAIAAIMKQ